MMSSNVYIFSAIIFLSMDNLRGFIDVRDKTSPLLISKAGGSNVSIAAGAESFSSTTRKPLIAGLKLPCSCQDGECSCCTGYILDRFNQKGCFNVSYDPDDFAITASITMNNRILYKNTVSGKNPPPMCVSIPRLPFIKFCMELSNVFVANRNIHFCIDAEANWQDFTLLEWSFDCLRMGASGVAVLSPEDGGGLPFITGDIGEQIDEDYDDSARSLFLTKTFNKIVFDESLTKINEHKIKSIKQNFKVIRSPSGDYVISYVENFR